MLKMAYLLSLKTKIKFDWQYFEAADREDAIQNFFYHTIFNEDESVKENEINLACEDGKITQKELKIPLALIEKKHKPCPDDGAKRRNRPGLKPVSGQQVYV